MMSKISRQGELSRRYTNHSIRSTAITVLDEAGAFKLLLNYFIPNLVLDTSFLYSSIIFLKRNI